MRLLLLLSLMATPAVAQSPLAGLALTDVGGAVHTFAPEVSGKGTVLVFFGIECPICNRYVPELNRLAGKKGFRLFAVVSDPDTTRAEVAKHREEYAVQFTELIDASGTLARRLRPTHVPEAFLFDAAGKLVYRGRIDNWFADIGKARPKPSRHDLADAMTAVAAGKPVAAAKTQPVGCFFEAWQKEPEESKVTYARDIAPILMARCSSCHRAGEIAPFSLTDYADAKKRARFLGQVTHSRYMPPWKPAPGHGAFRDTKRMTQEEIEIMRRWAEAGAPEGDAAELPPAPKPPAKWRLGKPDLVVKMSEPFTIPARGGDVYRCFPIPLPIKEDKMVVGVEYHPSAPAVVHHAIFYLDRLGRGRQLDADEDGPGYTRFGGIGFASSGSLGGYAPGAEPRFLPAGIGIELKKKSDLVLQVHYFSSGKAETDQGEIGLYFAKGEVKKTARWIEIGTRSIDIPAGEKRYRRAGSVTLPAAMDVVQIIPHMHLLGREMKVTAERPGGEAASLIWIKDWDFRWQGQYTCREPVRLARGTRLSYEAYYDNSADNPLNPNDPPERMRYGEGTHDEMCYCFMLITTDGKRDRWSITNAIGQAMFSRRR